MPIPVREELELLRTKTHADSLGEVIRRALSVYQYLVDEKANGARIVLETGAGQREVQFF